MKRRLFNIVVGVSLVLATIVTLLWIRSYWHFDEIGYIAGDGTPMGDGLLRSVRSEHGGIGVGRCDMPAQVEVYGWRYFHGPAERENQIRIYFWEGDSERFVFEGGGFLAQITYGEWRVIVPHWFVVLATLILPTTWFIRWRRLQRREATGLCRQCGYDVRATPDRCPECGTTTTRVVPHRAV